MEYIGQKSTEGKAPLGPYMNGLDTAFPGSNNAIEQNGYIGQNMYGT
jgi:hypothetical protein